MLLLSLTPRPSGWPGNEVNYCFAAPMVVVSCPDPPPKKQKEGLVFWAIFLVTWGGAYSIKNAILIAFIRDSSFWWLRMLHGTVYKSLIRPQKSREKAENELRDKFFLLVIWFKIRLLTSCTYNYAFCNLIRSLRSGSYPAPCDKKSCSEHQTLFLAHARKSVWARD